jgi:Fic family protein
MGEMAGAARRLANPEILLRPLRRREALSSSAMEGTYSTATDLVLLEADERAAASEETREVWNYARALEFGIDHLQNGGPLSQWLVRAIHKRLLKGLKRADPSTSPGEYKSAQNFIGDRTGPIERARFVPPPPLESAACMDQLESYLNGPDNAGIPPLIDAALVHYQFETIHPFADGNGRVGRILIPLRLIHRAASGGELLHISPYFSEHKDAYIDAMYEVSRRGDWAGWIDFFLVAVLETARQSTQTIDRLLELQARYRRLAREIGHSANLIALVDFLFERPAVTVPTIRDRVSVTYAAASRLAERLARAGVLSEIPNRYPKTYVAEEIVRIGRRESGA